MSEGGLELLVVVAAQSLTCHLKRTAIRARRDDEVHLYVTLIN